MKKIQLTIFLLFSFLIVNAQYLIIGDTTGYEVTEVEETFYPESIVSFDMDCDGIEDFNFHSIKVESNSPVRCSSYEKIEVNHHDSILIKREPNNGGIDTLQLGDTIYPTTPAWAAHWYIYLNCWQAWPGVTRSDDTYLLFRKVENNDTSFIQINFSNTGEIFTIHKIISECNNPFTIIKRGINEDTIDTDTETLVHPNPFREVLQLNINIENIKQVNLYDNTGRLLRQFFNTNRIDNLDFLPIGVYFLEIINVNNDRIVEKILKIDD